MSTESKAFAKRTAIRKAWFGATKSSKKHPYKPNRQAQNLAKHTTFKINIQ